MLRNILFDLDGTLLPMDMQKFIDLYFEALVKRFCPVLNIEPKTLIKGVWAGTEAMIKNNGEVKNEERFWSVCAGFTGEEILGHREEFDDFYRTDFVAAKKASKENPVIRKAVKRLKEKGYNLIVATSPVFPLVAVESRLSWANVDKEDFARITSYENCAYGKPNLKYYEEICKEEALLPAECMMVGNDVAEDMIASKLGMDTYLIKDCLINERHLNMSEYKQGSAEDFYNFAKKLPKIK